MEAVDMKDEKLKRAVEKLGKIGEELNQRFPEREEFINTTLNALVMKQHVLSVGPPGVGKSAITNLMAQAIKKNDSHFKVWSYQFNKFVTPDEVFGPMSLKAYEQDVVKRNPKNMLPEADLAVFEEVFKSNSATLNSVLGALNERVWFQEGKACPIPLRSALMNSNELPKKSDGLEAVVDRITQRVWVEKVFTQESFESIVFGDKDKRKEPLVNTITKDELDLICEAALALKFSSGAKEAVWQIRTQCSKHGIYISDRRIESGLEICKCQALREQSTLVRDCDLFPLQNVFWNEVEQMEFVKNTVFHYAMPWKSEIEDANSLLNEAMNELKLIKNKSARTEGAISVIQKVDMVEENIKDMPNEHPGSTSEVKKILRFCKAVKLECQKVVMPWVE